MKWLSFRANRSIEDYASTLAQHVAWVQTKYQSHQVILVGHSMGGLVSLAYAVHCPNHVAALVCIVSPLQGAPALRFCCCARPFGVATL